MVKEKIYKNNSIVLLLNCINKKGKRNIAKTILSNSSIDISKINNNYRFNKLFENIISNYTLSFKPNNKKDKHKNIYFDNYKYVSNTIKKILTNMTKNKKRVSFDFYFKKEIEKLLDNCIDLTCIKNRYYNNKKTYNKFEKYEDIEKLPLKNNIIKHHYKHSFKFNNNRNKIKNIIFSNYGIDKLTYKKN